VTQTLQLVEHGYRESETHHRLLDIAVEVHRLKMRHDATDRDLLEMRLAIGQHLLEAWKLLNESRRDYGRWLNRQRFGFSTRWAWDLRIAAERADEMRAVFDRKLASGQGFNFESALREITGHGSRRDPPTPTPSSYVDFRTNEDDDEDGAPYAERALDNLRLAAEYLSIAEKDFRVVHLTSEDRRAVDHWMRRVRRSLKDIRTEVGR
jgi:hypothetical protein